MKTLVASVLLLSGLLRPGLADEVISSDRVLSPTTVGIYRFHRVGDTYLLDLLVLWRGTPGWFATGNGGHGFVGGGQFGHERRTITYAGTVISVEFDDDKGTVKLLDRELSLKDTNVVLLDDTDRAPRAFETRWIDPQIVTSGEPVAAVVRRNPDLFQYLQCGADVPDDPALTAEANRAKQVVFAYLRSLCGQMKPE